MDQLTPKINYFFGEEELILKHIYQQQSFQ